MAKNKTKTGYAFKVLREELKRDDGTDTMHDTLYREDDGHQLGVVGRDYQFVPHLKVVNFAKKVLDAAGLEYEKPKIATALHGAWMKITFTLKSKRFAVKKEDEFDPTISFTNGYNGQIAFRTDFGIKRLVCLNGAYIVENRFSRRITHRFDKVDFDEVAPLVLEGIASVSDKMQLKYKKMASTPVTEETVKRALSHHSLRKKYANMIMKEAKIEEVESAEEGAEPQLQIPKNLTEYDFWNALTNVTTHQMRTYQRMHYEPFVGRLMVG